MGRRKAGTVRASGNRIQVGYTHQGERKWFTVDLKPTKANLDAVRSNIDEYVKRQTGERQSFYQAAQHYLDRAVLEESTRRSYRDSLNIYWMGMADSSITELSYADLSRVDEATDWPSAKTRRNAICALRGVFKHGYQMAQMNWRESPAHALQLGKMEHAEPDPYTRDERSAIIGGGGLFEALAFGTGARTGELIALKWECLDGNYLQIARSRVRSIDKGTKTDRPRSVVLPQRLAERLRSDPARFGGSEILRNQYGRPYMRGNKLLDKHRRLVESLGIRYRTPYAWRHTYASLALMDGASPAFIAQQLGHSEAVLRKHYARWIEGEYDQREMEKMQW